MLIFFFKLQTDSTPGDASPMKFRRRNSTTKKEQAAIRALKESEEDIPDVTALEQWYKLDENCNPPVFRLQNIRWGFVCMPYPAVSHYSNTN